MDVLLGQKTLANTQKVALGGRVVSGGESGNGKEGSDEVGRGEEDEGDLGVAKGKDVVVQYELKLEEGLTCGGNYTFFHVILVCHLHNGCVSLLQLFLLKVFPAQAGVQARQPRFAGRRCG